MRGELFQDIIYINFLRFKSDKKKILYQMQETLFS